jgi:hypothetical protein
MKTAASHDFPKVLYGSFERTYFAGLRKAGMPEQ